MRIYLYIKGENIFYSKDGEIGEISYDIIENFIKENFKATFYLIFSKLNTFFRKIEFEFTDKRKIILVLNQEIEGKFPVQIEDLYFYLKFFNVDKNKTIVDIFAIEKEKIEYLREIFNRNKAKYIFLIDSILLFQILKNRVHERSFIGIYMENDYLLIDLIENSVITGIYSYSSKNMKETIKDIFYTILSNKKLPVYFIGDKKIYEEIKDEKTFFLEEKNMVDILKEIKKFEIVSFDKILIRKRTPRLEYIFYFLFFIAVTYFFINPHFEKIEREKKINEINKKMENIYKSMFPETKKVINPLIQIKEKLMQNGNNIQIPISEISIIKVLEEITTLFPENINVEIEEVLIENKNINLLGNVENLKSIDIIKENIKKSNFFKYFEISSISFTKENKIKFNLFLKIGD
ncbi:MAG: hypothetical protein N2589_01260 [bacterium]|nr:hypothetical protein [bacterium]